MKVYTKVKLLAFATLFLAVFFSFIPQTYASVPSDKENYFKHPDKTSSNTTWDLIKKELFENTTNNAAFDNYPPGSCDLICGEWFLFQKNYYLFKDFADRSPNINASTDKKRDAWRKIAAFFVKSSGADPRGLKAANYIAQQITNYILNQVDNPNNLDNGAGSIDNPNNLDSGAGTITDNAVFTYARQAGSTEGTSVFVIPNYTKFVSSSSLEAFKEMFGLWVFSDGSVHIPTVIMQSDIGIVYNSAAWNSLLELYRLVARHAPAGSDDWREASLTADEIEKAIRQNTAYEGRLAMYLSPTTIDQANLEDAILSLTYVPIKDFPLGWTKPASYNFSVQIAKAPSATPAQTTDFNLITSGTFGEAGLGRDGIIIPTANLKAGYYQIRVLVTDQNGEQFTSTETSNFSYLQITGDDSGISNTDSGSGEDNIVTPPTTKITVSPKTYTIGTTSGSISVKGTWGGPQVSGMKCFLYIGDGQGTYWDKGEKNVSDCSFTWTPDNSTYVGSGSALHTAVIFFTAYKPNTISSKLVISPNPMDTTPYVSDVIKVCKAGSTACAASPTIGLSVNPSAVKKGSGISPKITATVSNPTSPDLTGKACYIYIGDQAGGWILKTSGSLTNCSLTWDVSGSTENLHGFIASIQPAGQNPAGPGDIKSAIRYIRVCAANATTCAAPTQPADPNTPDTNPDGTPATPVTPGETFNPRITSSSLIEKAGIKDALTSLEGIFNWLVGHIFPTFIGILAFFSIAIGGIMIMSSGGDQTKAEKGKKAILYGVIGIFIAILSYGIILVLIDEFKKGDILQ